MKTVIAFFTKAIDLCKRVPMLPIVVLSVIPVALLWSSRPWSHPFWFVDPSIGQWLVIAMVIYTVIDTLRGMIDDIRHGHVGVDILAVVAILSTLAVEEYWASWAVVLMIYSGEAIEEYAQSKAESNLTKLMEAAPQIAHVVDLPGVGAFVGASSARSHAHNADGFRSTQHQSQLADANDGAAKPANRIQPIDLSDAHATTEAHDDNACVLSGRDPQRCAEAVSTADQRFQSTADATNSVDSPTEDSGKNTAARTNAETSAASQTSAGDSHFNTVPVGQVRLGDVLQVLPGETVPVDGELLSGSATLDLSNINGEPVPREVFAGARVMSGAVNGSTTFTMRATELARDSQYQRILELVNSAQNSRATVVKTADLLAVPFTVIAFIIACTAWIVSGVPTRFAQVLVLATPCPLLIAAPVAYMAGTGRLAKAGILIKAQDVLENLGRVSHVFFDKTGTLTVKQPQVVRVEKPQHAETASGVGFPKLNTDHILMFAGVVESYSVHILAKGIAVAGAEALARMHAKYAAGQRACPEPESSWPGHGRRHPVVKNVAEDAGNGVSAEVNGHQVRVGRFAFVCQKPEGAQDAEKPSNSAEQEPTLDSSMVGTLFPDALAADEMVTYVSIDRRLAARIVLKDVPRSNAKQSLARLRSLGVKRLTMLTGDKAASARIIANEVGIDNVYAELFPEDKVAAVRNATLETPRRQPWWDLLLQRFVGESTTRSITMMVGDGVNDAPVLTAADIGMAITDGTSTAASESAQVVIMNDDIAAVPNAVAIARRTKRVMLQAVCIGLGLALIGMIVAAFNLIPVVIGAFMQEAIDVVSILWALTALLGRE